MTSGPVVVQVLEGQSAVENYRNIMGSTNPENLRMEQLKIICTQHSRKFCSWIRF